MKTNPLRLTITADDGSPLYKIEPYHNNLCYELFEWRKIEKRDGETEFGWVDRNLYPRNIEDALRIIERDMIMKYGGCISTVEEMRKMLNAVVDRICKITKET